MGRIREEKRRRKIREENESEEKVREKVEKLRNTVFFIVFSNVLGLRSVCVCATCIDVKLHYAAGACGTHVLPHAMKLWT